VKILVAEDNPLYRAVLQQHVERWGHEPVLAKNGLEAWEILQRDDSPRLAILDWQMPGVDGIELCRRVKRDAEHPFTYVVMLTSRDDSMSRATQLHVYNSAMFDQMELIKGHTPDKGADSLGGTLNLKSRSPLGMKEKRRITYNFSGRWAPPFTQQIPIREDHRLHPLFNVGYQEVFDAFGGDRNLGVAANLFYTAFGVLVALTPVMPAVWQTPALADLPFFAAVGGIGLVTLWMLDRAAAAAPLGPATPLILAQVPFTLTLGWVVGHGHPGAFGLACLVVVCAACLVPFLIVSPRRLRWSNP